MMTVQIWAEAWDEAVADALMGNRLRNVHPWALGGWCSRVEAYEVNLQRVLAAVPRAGGRKT